MAAASRAGLSPRGEHRNDRRRSPHREPDTPRWWRGQAGKTATLAYTRGVRSGLLLVLAVVPLLAAACQGTGGPMPDQPPHHLQHGYRNLNPEFTRPDFWTRWTFVIPRLFKSTFSAPEAFPIDPNDGRALRENRDAPTVTWVGTRRSWFSSME
jgi:hypothetical protein